MHVWIFVCACISLGGNSFLWYVVWCLAVWASGLRLAISAHSQSRKAYGRIRTAKQAIVLLREPMRAALGTQLWTINKNCPRRARLALPSCDHMDQWKPEIQQLWIQEFQDYTCKQSASETLLVPEINIWERKKKRPSNINTWDWS